MNNKINEKKFFDTFLNSQKTRKRDEKPAAGQRQIYTYGFCENSAIYHVILDFMNRTVHKIKSSASNIHGGNNNQFDVA